MTLEVNSLTWKENIEFKYLRTTGKLTTPTINASFTAKCNESCSMVTASPWTGQRSILPGQTITGDVTYRVSKPDSGPLGGITTKHAMLITQPGGIPTDPNASWTNPAKIRCDNEVAGTSGCVYPHIKPDLKVPLSKYGEAAATYLFQQQVTSNKWGTPSNPLHRLANERAQEDNRNKTCITAAEGTIDTPKLFVYKTSKIPTDSCDEYPFAGSTEGGTPGELCNDIELTNTDGTWNYKNANPSKPLRADAPCVRGHVPLLLNTNVGGDLGRLVQEERIVDFDTYTVTITA
ncbi:hypothetical protein [Streptomyces sp. NPDC095613]|uniref:hypothetical protein n=1 Tax=Streptomyces sp. NPDC095613 TaxID=3155540 RepID=UPI0033236E5E